MILTKVKAVTVVLLGVAVLGLGTGGLVYRAHVEAGDASGAQAAPGRDEARKSADEAERAWREARLAAEEARARAEEERRRAEEAEARVRKAEAQLANLERQLQALRQERDQQRLAGPPAPPDGGGNPPLADLERKYKHELDALEARRAELMTALKELDARREKMKQEFDAARSGLLGRQKEASDRPAQPPSADKLDQVLERLERIEKRLDRLERGRPGEKPGL